jgi:hypothetical protein
MKTTTTRRSVLAALSVAAVPLAIDFGAAAPCDDPVHEAIAAHRAAERAHSDAVLAQSRLESELSREQRQSCVYAAEEEISETDDPRWIAGARAVAEASNRMDDCAIALLNVRPTTLAGMSALFRYVSDEADAGCLPDGIEGDRRDFEHFEAALLSEAADWLGGMPAGSRPAAGAGTNFLANAECDPIFDLIEQHRAAVAEYNKAEAISGEIVPSPERDAAFAVTCAAMSRSGNLLEALLRSQPRTMAGALALLQHLGQDEYLGVVWPGAGEDDRETLLSTSNNSLRIDRKRLAQDFPLRLAAAMRDIVGATAKG